MTATINFVIESDAITVTGDHHAKFREKTFTDFTGTVAMPFRNTTGAGAFGTE